MLVIIVVGKLITSRHFWVSAATDIHKKNKGTVSKELATENRGDGNRDGWNPARTSNSRVVRRPHEHFNNLTQGI